MRSLNWLDPLVDQCGFGRYQIELLVQTCACGFASAAIFVILGSMVSHLPLQRWGVTRAEATLLQSSIFIGVTFGTLAGGVFADRYGRRSAVLISYVLLIISAAALVSVQGYFMMIAACFMFGAVGGFSLPPMNALLVENSPSGRRGTLVCLSSFMWFLGELYGAGCVWFLGETTLPLPGAPATGFHWRACFMMGFLPAIPIVIYAFFSLMESPRFLAMQGRKQEAQKVLNVIAQKNGVVIPLFPASPELRDRENQLETAEAVTPTWRETFKTLQIIIVRWPVNVSTAGLMVLCIVCNFAYYGLIFALPQILHDQKGANSLLGGASVQVFVVTLFKIPGIFAAFFLLQERRIGHKSCLGALLGVTAVCAWSYPKLIGMGYMTAAFSSACCLKLATSAAFIILYVFVLEVYPTQIRSTGMAICTMVGILGSILSPIIHATAVAYGGHHAYFMTIAGFSLFAGTVALGLPYDTKGRPLGEGEESETSSLMKK